MRRRGGRIADSCYPGPFKRTGASYLANRLEAAGDLGMGGVAVASLGVLAVLKGELSALLVLVSSFGALLAALYWGYKAPGKELIGDIGTYSIGALIAITVILGGVELAGVIVLIPYLLNLVVKVRGYSLAQLIHKLTGFNGGKPVLVLIALELVFGLIAISLYL